MDTGQQRSMASMGHDCDVTMTLLGHDCGVIGRGSRRGLMGGL